MPLATIPFLAQYCRFSGHRGERMMYETLLQEYYLPDVGNDVCQTVEDCQDCPKEGTVYGHLMTPQVVFRNGPTCVLAINIPESSRSAKGDQFVASITDCYSKLTRAIVTAKVAALRGALIFPKYQVMQYGIGYYLLSDNGAHFLSKIFLSH